MIVKLVKAVGEVLDLCHDSCRSILLIFTHAFGRCFYPKQLSAFRLYILSVCVFCEHETHDLGIASTML